MSPGGLALYVPPGGYRRPGLLDPVLAWLPDGVVLALLGGAPLAAFVLAVFAYPRALALRAALQRRALPARRAWPTLRTWHPHPTSRPAGRRRTPAS